MALSRYCQPGAANCAVCAITQMLLPTWYVPDQGESASIRLAPAYGRVVYEEPTAFQLIVAVIRASM